MRQHVFQMMCQDMDDVMSCFIIARERLEGTGCHGLDLGQRVLYVCVRHVRGVGVEGRYRVGRKEGRIKADASDS